MISGVLRQTLWRVIERARVTIIAIAKKKRTRIR